MRLMNVNWNYFRLVIRCIGLAVLAGCLAFSSSSQAPAPSTVLFRTSAFSMERAIPWPNCHFMLHLAPTTALALVFDLGRTRLDCGPFASQVPAHCGQEALASLPEQTAKTIVGCVREMSRSNAAIRAAVAGKIEVPRGKVEQAPIFA
jgi:hypothetical protein